MAVQTMDFTKVDTGSHANQDQTCIYPCSAPGDDIPGLHVVLPEEDM